MYSCSYGKSCSVHTQIPGVFVCTSPSEDWGMFPHQQPLMLEVAQTLRSWQHVRVWQINDQKLFPGDHQSRKWLASNGSWPYSFKLGWGMSALVCLRYSSDSFKISTSSLCCWLVPETHWSHGSAKGKGKQLGRKVEEEKQELQNMMLLRLLCLLEIILPHLSLVSPLFLWYFTNQDPILSLLILEQHLQKNQDMPRGSGLVPQPMLAQQATYTVQQLFVKPPALAELAPVDADTT